MRRFWHNFEIKILALLSAILLWLFVVGVEKEVVVVETEVITPAEEVVTEDPVEEIPEESPLEAPEVVQKNLLVEVTYDTLAEFPPQEVIPGSILVTIEGLEDMVEEITSESIVVDLKPAEVDGTAYTIKTADISLPAGIALVEFSPERVRVRY